MGNTAGPGVPVGSAGPIWLSAHASTPREVARMTAPGTSDGVTFQPLPLAGDIITGTSDFIDGRFALENCFPNPVKDKTTIGFRINVAQRVTLTLYDMSGRPVLVLLDKVMEPGAHQIERYLGDLRSGVYQCEMKSGFFKDSKSLAIVK